MPIFDQGYQHWKGPLSGHGWRWWAIARQGLRVQMKNRLLRLLMLVAWLPAVVLVVAMAIWGLVEQHSAGVLSLVRSILPADVLLEPSAYRTTIWTLAYSFFFKFEMFFIMLLVVLAGPGLISRDLRFNALPLYFARPLTRLDYFLGKLGVIGALVAAVAVGPAVFAYVVGICFSLDLGVVRDTYPVLLGSVATGLVITFSAGTLILALSSLTRRSLYVGIAFAGFWLIGSSVGTILTELNREMAGRALYEGEMAKWLAEHPPPPGIEMHGSWAVIRQEAGLRPGQDNEAGRWYQAWGPATAQAREKAQARQGETLRSDWRPLCSYVANLDRMGDLFLNTDAAWVMIGKAVERPRAAIEGAFGPGGFGPRGRRGGGPPNERRLADQMVLQYPWEWSAGVLAGLIGLSTWTMTRRIKSLDQLR
jgi:ABC-2 type transport system permease protein